MRANRNLIEYVHWLGDLARRLGPCEQATRLLDERQKIWNTYLFSTNPADYEDFPVVRHAR